MSPKTGLDPKKQTIIMADFSSFYSDVTLIHFLIQQKARAETRI
jgi:hypothetical protein